MNIKMIAVDLDDTLLRNDKTVSGRTLATLAKCRDHGIKVIYATARGPSADSIVSPELFDGTVKMCGAVAYVGDLPVHRQLISMIDSKDFLLAVCSTNIQIAVEVDGWTYSNFSFSDDWDPIFFDSYKVTDFNSFTKEVEKIWAMPVSDDEIDLIKQHLPEGLYMTVARNDNFTMIMREDTNKMNAINALAEHWGIKSTEIVAFGDDVIDIDMLRHCGIGVAMGNAVDEVKAVANQICDTNENDGVAKWLEEHVL